MPRGGAYQTRSFLYDSAGRPYQSSNPETGTTTTAYNQNGTVASVTDAKGQIKKFDYDSYNRVTAVHRWTDYSTEDLKQKVEYYYDSNPYEGDMGAYLAGRLAAVHYWSLRGKSYFGTDYAEVMESYGYSQAGAVTKKRMRVKARWAADHNSPYVEQAMDVSYAYDNQGRRTQMVYPPAVSGGGSLRTLNYTYDSMGRPYSMTEAGGPNWVPSMSYNLAGQVTSGPHGAYQYNILGQMTRQTYTSGSVVFDEQYQFSATNNNGKMLSKQNLVTGEDVQYTYDSLQRLASAQTVQTPTTAAPQWGDSYSYDGYGNLTDMTPIGTGLNMHITVAASTNRQNGVAYDANGNDVGANTNPTTRVYDVDNRLSVVYSGLAYGTEYGYAPDNKRILKSEPWDGFIAYETKLYFHGVGGERLGEYRLNFQNSGASLSLDLVAGNTWFGGKLLREGDWNVVQDAKGSVRWRKNALTSAVETADYYPYGQEKPGATTDNRQKFGTYLRDSETGLDYADQRYMSSTVGRFMTADPYKASGGPGDPGSWNRYSYVEGDPVNWHDPRGLFKECPQHDGCAPVWPDRDPTECSPEYWTFYCIDTVGGSAAAGGVYDNDGPTDAERRGPKGGALTDPSTTGGTGAQYLQSIWSHCSDIFDGLGINMTQLLTTLRSDAGHGGIRWLNAMDYNTGRQTLDSFLHNGDTQTLREIVAGSNATRIPGTHLVIVSADYFWDNTQTEQIGIAIHEALHIVTNRGDISLQELLVNGGFIDREAGSHDITTWITNNCK